MTQIRTVHKTADAGEVSNEPPATNSVPDEDEKTQTTHPQPSQPTQVPAGGGEGVKVGPLDVPGSVS